MAGYGKGSKRPATKLGRGQRKLSLKSDMRSESMIQPKMGKARQFAHKKV